MKSLSKDQIEYITKEYELLSYHDDFENVKAHNLENIMTETSFLGSGYKLDTKIAGFFHIAHMIKFGRNLTESIIYFNCFNENDYISRARILYPLIEQIFDDKVSQKEYMTNDKYRPLDFFVNNGSIITIDSKTYSELCRATFDIYNTYNKKGY